MLRSYRDLEVWKRSVLLIKDVYGITRRFPLDERFGLTSQIRRAAVSISCNIAEGYGRSTRGEYLNHLSFARGSLFEVEALISVANELSLLRPEELTSIETHCVHLRRMLRGLKDALKRKK